MDLTEFLKWRKHSYIWLLTSISLSAGGIRVEYNTMVSYVQSNHQRRTIVKLYTRASEFRFKFL